MDPLSVVANAFALAKLASSAIKGIQRLNDALRDGPTEILALNNEVADLQAILQIARELAETTPNGQYGNLDPLEIPRTAELLRVYLAHAEEKLVGLNALLERCLAKKHRLQIQLQWLQEKKEAAALQRGLRDLKKKFNTGFMLTSAKNTSRIELTLVDFEANRQRDSDNTLEILSEIQSQLAKMQLPQESSRTGLTPSTPNKASVVSIRAISANTPFNSMLGFLFVGYSGLPVIRAPCNERSCKRRSDLSLMIVYFFPLWFLARYLSMSIKVDSLMGPVINIRTPRLIRWMDKEAQLFHFAKADNIDGIKHLFSARVASPFDLTVAQGESALFHAASFGQFKTCKFLIDEGADPNASNMNKVKPVECAWQWILNDRLDLETTSYVREIFDDSDFLETRQFSVLHKIVLGLLPSKDLAVDLQASTAQIDDVDVSGRTCMSWAAARSDLKSVKTLLAHRAKLDKCDNSGYYPLHYAALARDPCCIQVLLDHHAKVDCKNAHGGTPLHMACRGDDERFIIPLLDAGADINAGGSENETALMAAVRNGRLKTAKLLLDRGADANAKTIWGVTALVLCVIYGNPAMLEFLLSRPEVDVLSTDINGRTVLHHAASHGIVENVAVLLKDGLRGIDIDAEDSDEITVWDLLEERGLEELTTLFEAIREDEEKDLSVIITVDAST
ncbi:hypothetical protein O988_06230 [Pseudogymnoascus sp. VKM F-3808]|nr:hypothetical protein O988_06230 [Pseudogymnoascus sp. VKM F-3808]